MPLEKIIATTSNTVNDIDIEHHGENIQLTKRAKEAAIEQNMQALINKMSEENITPEQMDDISIIQKDERVNHEHKGRGTKYTYKTILHFNDT